jgi:hypothetical protein
VLIPILYLKGLPPAWAALPGIGRMNDASVFDGVVVRESVHKLGYGHKFEGSAATSVVA